MSVKWRGLRDFQPPSVLIKHARASGGAAIGPHGRGLLGDCGMQRCRLLARYGPPSDGPT